MKRKIVVSILLSLFIANVLAWISVWGLSRSFLKVVFFDVGQGDSIFIQTPNFHQILIDGGPGSSVEEKLGKQMLFWDRTIDLIVLTHPEKDHIEGLLEVLKKYKVENIFWTGEYKDSSDFNEWEKLIKEESADVRILRAGQRIIFSDNLNSDIEVLFPFKGEKETNINDTSAVLRLSFGKTSFLFSGDISKSAEKRILQTGSMIDSDVLKVGHHGSKYSSSEEFIKEISPEVAVIQVGKDNTYGHPHQEVLDIFNRYGIKVLRTDQNADIEIISDGNKLQINN